MVDKKEEKLYIKILLWLYERQEEAFTLQEVTDKFGLSKEKVTWFTKVFQTIHDSDRKLIEHINSDYDSVKKFILNEKGFANAIDYIELQEARASSRKALWFAGTSMVIAIVVGLVQIGVQIKYAQYTSLAESGYTDYTENI